jgi:hypothetical protein
VHSGWASTPDPRLATTDNACLRINYWRVGKIGDVYGAEWFLLHPCVGLPPGHYLPN